MKIELRLSFFWITTLFFINSLNGQIIFINPPADTVVSCNNFIAFPDDPEVVDDCSGNPFIFFFDASTKSNSTDTCAFFEYTVTRTFSAMNSCADTSIYVQIITVVDTTPPVFEAPPAVTVNCSQINNLELTGDLEIRVDECGGLVQRNYVDENKPIRCDSTIIRTWIVTDICGNSSTATQEITIIDNEKPEFINRPRDISVMCSMTPNPYPVFNDWVENLGYSSSRDACNPVNFTFAAIPGTYDVDDPSTFPGQSPGGLDPTQCGVVEGALQFETVDFVIVDVCGNALAESATFYYIDDVFPTLDGCDFDITVNLDGSDCFTTLTYDVPLGSDSCAMENLEFRFSDLQNITSSAPGDPSVIVDDIEFRLGPYGPEIEFGEQSFFTVEMKNVDGDGSGETFIIVDENNSPIGISENTSEECGTIRFELGPFSKVTMENWAADEFIDLRFTPSLNEVSSNSINDVCSFSTIEVFQVYTLNNAADSVEIFFGLDDNPLIPVDDITIEANLDAGIHIVRFVAQDCAGNRTTCPQRVTVRDNTSPQLNCGVSRQVDTDPGICGLAVPLNEIAIINNPCLEDIDISVEVVGAMNTLLEGDYNSMRDSIITFPVGASTIRVSASDFSGNQSGCTFNLEIEDNELPTAICETVLVEAVAVDLEQFTVDAFLIAGNSTDNCGIRNIVLENNEFSCGDIGQIFNKTVLVIDESNNISTCNGTFSITETEIPISYTVGICPEDTLKFSLGIPQRDEYVYDWDGPFGFSSVLAEPFIPNVQSFHEGMYFLTVRNVNTGCESTASIDVEIDDFQIPNLYTDEIGCETVPHVLSTDPFPGENIRYEWYFFDEDGRTLLATTDTSFVELELGPGSYSLAVIIANSFCQSRTSEKRVVDVRVSPEGAICSALIQGCEGLPLELCVDDPEDDFIIRWSGPNGFTSSEEKPIVTDSFTQANSGVYNLIIEQNSCITDTLTTSVLFNETPPTPEIIGSGLFCSGDTIVLSSSIVGEDYVYVWTSPSGTIRNNQPTLRVPNAGANFNGAWRLSLENGPCSSRMSEPLIVDIEPIFSFQITTDPVQCEGSLVTLTTTAPPESSFAWEGPNGFTSNEFNPTIAIVPGMYRATINTRNGCFYTDNIFITTVVIPDIFAVEVSDEGNCLDPNSSVTIIPTLNQSADVFYEWTGPNIESRSSSLVIPNYSEIDNGVYSVKVLNGACESDVFTFALNYIISPDQPVIDTDPIACIGDSLTLTTSSYGPAATYQWLTPTGLMETSENRLGLGNVTTDLSGNYSLQVIIGECTSPESSIVDITVNENTFVPTIITEGEECLQAAYQIYADLSGGLSLEWELPDGSILVIDTINLELQESDSGMYRVRSLSNGCPSDWSSPIEIDVADPRIGLSFTSDFIFSCNNDDSGLEFCVDDNAGLTGEIYKWYLGEELLGQTTSSCFQVEDPSVFAFGRNEITLRIDYNNCVVQFDEPLFLEIENVRNIDVDAGLDQLFCVGEGVPMNADEVNTPKLSAFWSVDSGVEVDDIKDPMAMITVLEDLDSTFAVWNVEHIDCGVVYRDSVVLRQKVKPQPVLDSLVMDDNEITFNPLENDILLDGNNYELTEVSEPRWGDASFSGNAIVYKADSKFIGGPISFTYTVCDDACEVLCNTGEVLLLYNAESCRGNNVLTPNNDGANDRFVIPCIENENLPESSLIILNEVGNTVFEQAPYDNTWDGTFNGEPLGEGTYYYIFRKDPEATVVQGFIALER